jgi:transcription initiation factor IIE alpha subunit
VVLRRIMATLHAVGIRMCCPECGETTTAGLAWAKRQQVFPCPGCGAGIRPEAVEIRREIARVEREWTRLWEQLRRNAEPYC